MHAAGDTGNSQLTRSRKTISSQTLLATDKLAAADPDACFTTHKMEPLPPTLRAPARALCQDNGFPIACTQSHATPRIPHLVSSLLAAASSGSLAYPSLGPI